MLSAANILLANGFLRLLCGSFTSLLSLDRSVVDLLFEMLYLRTDSTPSPIGAIFQRLDITSKLLLDFLSIDSGDLAFQSLSGILDFLFSLGLSFLGRVNDFSVKTSVHDLLSSMAARTAPETAIAVPYNVKNWFTHLAP